MADWPLVIALIVTYRRLPLALQTIRSVKDMVDYSNIGFHIADDGSGEEYVTALREEIGDAHHVTGTDSARAGVGRNMNMGIEAALQRADLWLHLEDDWALQKPLELEPCVRLLQEDDTVGMVRLGRMSGGVTGETMGGADRLWWRLKRNSDTYVFSGNAALRHRRFHAAYGPYREGLMPGQTELTYCATFNKKNGPDIAWPAWLSTQDAFLHIGDSQSFKWWQETGGKTAEEAAEMFEAMNQEAVQG